MKKNKLLLWLVGILLVSNMLMAAILFFKSPHPPFHEGPRNIIIERLQLDAQQVQAYDVLIAQHRKQILAQEAKIFSLKSQYYALLNFSPDQALTDSLTSEISKATLETEKINFAHFEDIKKICRPGEQMDKFKLLIDNLAELFSRKPKKKGKR